MPQTTSSEGTGVELAGFLRREHQDIVAGWVSEARRLPEGRTLPHEQLVDDIPTLLDHLADMVEQLADGEAAGLPAEAVERHAEHRLNTGFELTQVGTELALLRRVIVDHWEARGQAGREDERRQSRLLNTALDRLLVGSIDRYARMLRETAERLHAEAARAVELRDQVLAVVSHDLRNPVGTIDLACAVLFGNAAIRGDREARKHLEIIQRNVGQVDRLLSDLLDMSAIQAGRLSIAPRSCAIGSILREAVDAHGPLAADAEASIALEAYSDENAVLCDPDRIHQVLGNLLGNAIKFCQPGCHVTIRAETAGGAVRIAVADTGPGVDPEERERMFEPYWKREPGRHGTGLGLFIARGIVEAHGGRIWAESTPGAGTTVYFTLPFAPPETGVP
ncbi:MAG: ATP-binding protein [Myxococcota bacterium]